MGTYVVERYLTGWNDSEVGALLCRLDELEPRFELRNVHYLQSIVLDEDETCLSVFTGSDAAQVRLANDEFGLPTDRVVTATFAGQRGSRA
jgi:hypothetical protein